MHPISSLKQEQEDYFRIVVDPLNHREVASAARALDILSEEMLNRNFGTRIYTKLLSSPSSFCFVLENGEKEPVGGVFGMLIRLNDFDIFHYWITLQKENIKDHFPYIESAIKERFRSLDLLCLHIAKGNDDSVTFYTNNGFENRETYGTEESILYMVKKLSDKATYQHFLIPNAHMVEASTGKQFFRTLGPSAPFLIAHQKAVEFFRKKPK